MHWKIVKQLELGLVICLFIGYHMSETLVYWIGTVDVHLKQLKTSNFFQYI
uniref:Uncharacterized protein n=1 Tax=Rhizophagus irregularis (strain DAOM 181602 / DAOM 197198 / MUCL 43194) TaxID=747089 RepID=U9TEM5_RHIID